MTGRGLGKPRANGRSGGGAESAPGPIPEVFTMVGRAVAGRARAGSRVWKRGDPASSPGPAVAARAAAGKACGEGPKMKIWGRAGGAGASANDGGVQARGGAERHGKLTAGERGTAGHRPFAAGPRPGCQGGAAAGARRAEG